MTKCSVWTTSVQICEAHVPFCSEVLHCFNIFTYTDSFKVTRPYNRTTRPLLLSPYPYLPPPPPPLSPGQGCVTLLSRSTWLGTFALCFAKTAVVSRREKLTKVRNNS